MGQRAGAASSQAEIQGCIFDFLDAPLSPGGLTDGEPLNAALLDLACAAVEAFAIDGTSSAAYRALARLSPAHAQQRATCLSWRSFKTADIAAFDDAALLCLVTLLAAAGRLADASSVLADAEARRPAASFRRGAFAARCRILGHQNGIAELWLTSDRQEPDPAGARAAVSIRPVDIAAHATLIRQLAATGALDAALDALAVALTLVPKKLAQLSNNYPDGIAVSLHNDSQESYALTRSAKIGDYDTLVERLTALTTQMVAERAPSHLRLYQMVSNGAEEMRVDPSVRSAFAASPARLTEHVRTWEAIAAAIAVTAPAQAKAKAIVNDSERIARSFFEASHDDGIHVPIIEWTDVKGDRRQAFFSPPPVGTYANLLLEYHPDWSVGRTVLNTEKCGFVAAPALAIFATGRLGICCLDLNSTAAFTSLDDHDSLAAAMTSPAAARMFAQVANGVAASRGCQICLSSDTRMCGR